MKCKGFKAFAEKCLHLPTNVQETHGPIINRGVQNDAEKHIYGTLALPFSLRFMKLPPPCVEMLFVQQTLIYFSFSRNFGKEAVMYAVFCHTCGDYVAVMDVDMQDPPSLLPKMLQLIQSGEYDSVATRRVDREGEPPIRSWFAKKFHQIMSRISNTDMADGARDFRLMPRPMVDAIVSLEERTRFSKGIFGNC